MPAEDIISRKKEKAVKLAGEKGYLTRKEFALLLELSPSRVSNILKMPDFGEYIKQGDPDGKGQVWIPLSTVLNFIDIYFKIL